MVTKKDSKIETSFVAAGWVRQAGRGKWPSWPSQGVGEEMERRRGRMTMARRCMGDKGRWPVVSVGEIWEGVLRR